MEKFRLGKEGVSEIIGTILLLAIAISAFSVLAVYVFSNQGNTPVPHLNLVGYMDENHNAIIEHRGGDSIKLENIRVIIWKGEMASHECTFPKSVLQNYNHTISMGNSIFYDAGNNKRWDVGDYIKIDCPAIFGNISHWQISVMVIDKQSNSIIMSGILQEGITHTVPPVAMFTYEPQNPKVNRGIIFNASASYDPDGGSIIQYKWDFDDGTIETKYSPVTTHQYAHPGVYYVTLTVVDNEGEETSVTAGVGIGVSIPPINVTVNRPPVAYFINITQEDGWVYFDASQSYDPDGTVVKYIWDFGDGHTQIKLYDPTIKWQYAKGGQNYTVTLVVEDNDGATSSAVTSITLYGKQLYVPPIPPIAIITAPADISTASDAFFSGADSYDPDGDALVNFSWDFNGDGNPDAYGVNVTYHFYQVGNYTINLTVVDSSGGIGYASRTIYVRAPIAARRFLIVDNTPVYVQSGSLRPYRSYNWEGISNIIHSLNIGDVYDYGKAIDDSYFYAYHNETGWHNSTINPNGPHDPVNINESIMKNYDIVIWSTGDYPGDGKWWNSGPKPTSPYLPNAWTTPMTEGYDDYANHMQELKNLMAKGGVFLLTGTYAVRDLQDYWGNWASQDEIDFGEELGLNEPTGGIDESLHTYNTIAYFADDAYNPSLNPYYNYFRYGPIYAQGVLYGIANTSSGGVNLTIEQPMPLYSLVKQPSSDFKYSLQAAGQAPIIEGFENPPYVPPTGWATVESGSGGVGQWRDSLYGSAHSGSHWAYAWGRYGNPDCWLITPRITIPTNGMLSFWYRAEDSRYPQAFEVRLSTGTSQTDISQFTHLLWDSGTFNHEEYVEQTIDLSSYAGQQVYIGFHYYYSANRWWGINLDDISISSNGIPSGYYAIDATRGQNRSVVLGFDLNSPAINDTDRENYILHVVNWLAEAVGYPTKIYVDNNKPDSWYDDTHVGDIQDAINRVMVGGTIYINGTPIPYTSFNVIKSVNIVGVDIGNGYPLIKTSGEYAVKIGVDWVTLENIRIEGMGNLQKGIYMASSSSDTIINCRVSQATYGIYAFDSHYLTVRNSTFLDNDYDIYLERCVKSSIMGNNVQGGLYGIYAKESPKIFLESNRVFNNTMKGIYIESGDSGILQYNHLYNNYIGASLYLSTAVNARMNTIYNNTKGICLEQSTNGQIYHNVITNNQQGVVMSNYSNGINLLTNTITQNEEGIMIFNSNYVTIYNNSLSSNSCAIKLMRANNNVIAANKMENNPDYGIYAESSLSNEITNNTIQNSNYAIYMYSIMDALVVNNTINNSRYGIYLYDSHPSGGNNTIANNHIYGCDYGIDILHVSNENVISDNILDNITNWGISIQAFSNNNQVVQNTIRGTPYAIYIEDSSYNNISGNNIVSPSVGIYLSSSDNNNIINDTIEADYYGIYIDLGSNSNIITNTDVSNCLYGLYISSSYSTVAENNSITYSTEGIVLENSDLSTIRYNEIYSNENGIHLAGSGGSGNTIEKNSIHDNSGYAIILENSRRSTAGNNELRDNTIFNNGKSAIYLLFSNTNSINQNEIYSNENGIFVNSSDDNSIGSNIIYNNSENGISMISSNGNRIYNNSLSYNYIGLYFYLSSEGDQYKIGGNRIWNNTIGVFLNSSDSNYFGYNIVNEIWNNSYGVYIVLSSNNHFNHNIIWGNEYGIYMENSSTANEFYENNFTINNYSIYISTGDCSSNTIYSNNFINNTLHNNSQAWDRGNNSWYVSTTGNYWSDYNGTDGDGNGRGDTPYTIPPSLNRDLYPLMAEVKWW